MKNRIISLKWKIVFPLACLFFLMAFAIVYLTSSMTGKAMFDLSEQQANNVLYLVDLNVNDIKPFQAAILIIPKYSGVIMA